LKLICRLYYPSDGSIEQTPFGDGCFAIIEVGLLKGSNKRPHGLFVVGIEGPIYE